MPELLIEIFSEEIPARMQARAADDLKRLVLDGLKAEGLVASDALAMATPRRLALVVRDLPAASPAISDERKGPRVGAPAAAIEGFLKSTGLTSIEAATVVKDPKKGDFYTVRIDKPGRAAPAIVGDVLPKVMARFPWPKSMRWGGGTETWVRPIGSIICMIDGTVVPFAFAGIESGAETRGHRFHGNAPFKVKGFEDYAVRLKDAKVLLLGSERAEMIRDEAQAIAAKAKLDLIEDEGLLAENAGLAEWPVVLMGTFEAAFLAVPAECLITSMRMHQKCFSLRDPKTGKLANRFLMVSNLTPKDDGRAIVSGNEKVIRARLSDAKFFWEGDLKRPLDDMWSALRTITFHDQLGSQHDRVERIAALAEQLAATVDADKESARRAAQLCKADLVSGMVGEFPELQGLMGRYYAEAAGTKPEIARAIELHYKPKGPTDSVPLASEGDAVGCAVALADKLDTLVGFWAIGEKPTGSGDPYQLRRAALGVIRIVLANDFRAPLGRLFKAALRLYHNQLGAGFGEAFKPADLTAFFLDRLKVHLREDGVRHDIVDAVLGIGGQDDIALIVKRVTALSELIATEDGANLLAGVKRAANILAIEEKKDKRRYDGAPAAALMSEPQEQALSEAIAKARTDTAKAIDVENFAGAMRAIAELRAPVDAFFDKVTVNVPDPKVRENRLAMLAEIRAATSTVADFARIAG